jgi:hypothetical protein
MYAVNPGGQSDIEAIVDQHSCVAARGCVANAADEFIQRAPIKILLSDLNDVDSVADCSVHAGKQIALAAIRDVAAKHFAIIPRSG